MLHFECMCKGPDEKQAKLHEDKAQFHSMMSKFYTLKSSDQKVFMAMFDQICKNLEEKKKCQAQS